MQTAFKIYITKEQQELLTALDNNWGKNYEREHYKNNDGSYKITKWAGSAHCDQVPIISFRKGKPCSLLFDQYNLGEVIGFDYDKYEGDYYFDLQLRTKNSDDLNFNSLLANGIDFDLKIKDVRPKGLDSFGWTVVYENTTINFEDARATDEFMFG